MGKITIIEHNSNDKDNIRAFFLKGEKGDTGDTGNGIVDIVKTASVGNVDTYTITYTNGSTDTFQIFNGEGATVVVDNLTDTSTDKALSSNQGRVLKGLIDDLDTTKIDKDYTLLALGTKLNKSDVIDNLTSTDTDKPLSANQGKVLKTAVDGKISTSNIVDDLISTDTDKPLSANQGRVLNNSITNLQKHIMTAKMTSDLTLSSTAETDITLSDYNSVGTGKLTLTNGKIVIGSGVSKVLVSAQAYVTQAGSGNRLSTELNIYKNSSLQAYSLEKIDTNNVKTMSVAPILISVSNGDTISLKARGNTGDIISGNNVQKTYLTVEVMS